ncbi:MAG: type II toxin-antitoxin system Phd/YefM family antitoxin [bacterium]
MQATIVDLRYHMNDVLKALERNESVSVLYRGTVKGILRSISDKSATEVADHPFFGMLKSGDPVDKVMHDLRGGRCHDL